MVLYKCIIINIAIKKVGDLHSRSAKVSEVRREFRMHKCLLVSRKLKSKCSLCARHFNGRFPLKPGLSGCHLDSHSHPYLEHPHKTGQNSL